MNRILPRNNFELPHFLILRAQASPHPGFPLDPENLEK